MSRKILSGLLVAIAIVAMSAFVVSAQSNGDDDSPPYGEYPGWMHGQYNGEFGPGMMGPGMMWAEDGTMFDAIAEALGLELDALLSSLQQGQTLAEIAEAQGVEMDVVYTAIQSRAAEHMSALVEAGTITSEEAGEHLAWLNENIETMPMFTGNGFGHCANGAMFAGGNHRGRGMRNQ